MEKRIGFLSKTEGGKNHDFPMLKKYASPDNMPTKIKKHLDFATRKRISTIKQCSLPADSGITIYQ